MRRRHDWRTTERYESGSEDSGRRPKEDDEPREGENGSRDGDFDDQIMPQNPRMGCDQCPDQSHSGRNSKEAKSHVTSPRCHSKNEWEMHDDTRRKGLKKPSDRQWGMRARPGFEERTSRVKLRLISYGRSIGVVDEIGREEDSVEGRMMYGQKS